MKIYENKKEVFISKECLKREVVEAGRVMNNSPRIKSYNRQIKREANNLGGIQSIIGHISEEYLEQLVYRDAIIRSLTSVLDGVLIYAQNELDNLYAIESKDCEDCGSEEAEFAIKRAKDMLALMKGK